MRFGLGSKILIFFAAMVIIVVSNFVIFTQAEKDSAEQQSQVLHAHNVLERSETFLGNMRDAETGQRGFLLTLEERYLEPYEVGVSKAQTNIKNLAELTRDNPVQHKHLDAIHDLMVQKFRELSATVELAREGRIDEALVIVKNDEGKQIMDDIRAHFEEFKQEEQRLLEERVEEYRNIKNNIRILFSAEGAVLVLLITIAGLLIQRTLVRPLNQLTINASKIGAGETLDMLVVERNDEIGQLATAFNNMYVDMTTRTDEIKKEAHFRRSFSQILAACTATPDLNKSLSNALGIQAHDHPSPVGAVYVYNESTERLVRIASYGTSDDLSEDVSSKSGLIGQVYRNGERLVVTADSAEGFHLETGLGNFSARAVVLQPLKYGIQVLGILVLAYISNPDEDDLEYIEKLGAQFGVTVVNGLQYASLQRLTKDLEKSRQKVIVERDEAVLASITDPLTGLHNRGYLDLELERLKKISARYNHDLALIILDIDYFKRINDTLGHPVGDEVLKALSAVLKQETRASDLLARYGGEEFVGVLPETTLGEAEGTAEKLRKAVEKMDVPALGGERITISLGVAMLSKDDDDMGNLLARADEALYRAKEEGRNRVCLADS